MTDDRASDPAAIEQDIRHTQDEIGDTIGKLEDQLSPKKLARSVLGDDGNAIAQEALDIARRNPIPVTMIAVGAIWLLATARTRDGRTLVDGLMDARRSPSGSVPQNRATADRAPSPVVDPVSSPYPATAPGGY
jgi:hypothetical protein